MFANQYTSNKYVVCNWSLAKQSRENDDWGLIDLSSGLSCMLMWAEWTMKWQQLQLKFTEAWNGKLNSPYLVYNHDSPFTQWQGLSLNEGDSRKTFIWVLKPTPPPCQRINTSALWHMASLLNSALSKLIKVLVACVVWCVHVCICVCVCAYYKIR